MIRSKKSVLLHGGNICFIYELTPESEEISIVVLQCFLSCIYNLFVMILYYTHTTIRWCVPRWTLIVKYWLLVNCAKAVYSNFREDGMYHSCEIWKRTPYEYSDGKESSTVICTLKYSTRSKRRPILFSRILESLSPSKSLQYINRLDQPGGD